MMHRFNRQHLAGALLVAAASATSAQAETPAEPAPIVCDAVWHDSARNRDMPLRIRMPAAGARMPVVLFSHGLGGSVAAGTRWAADWNTAGFAVIHLQHPGSDTSVWEALPQPQRIAALKAAVNA